MDIADNFKLIGNITHTLPHRCLSAYRLELNFSLFTTPPFLLELSIGVTVTIILGKRTV